MEIYLIAVFIGYVLLIGHLYVIVVRIVLEDALLVVRPHVAALGEGQAAVLAGVGLEARVEVHVRLQVVLFRKAFRAQCASIWLDA